MSEALINEISHMFNDISGEYGGHRISCMCFADEKSRKFLGTWVGIILFKDSSRNALKENKYFVLQRLIDLSVAVQIPTIRSSCNHP